MKVRTQQFLVVAASSSGGEPPVPPAAVRAVAEDGREPGRRSHWLLGAAMLLVGGTVSLVLHNELMSAF
jgi:hypothetical protein